MSPSSYPYSIIPPTPPGASATHSSSTSVNSSACPSPRTLSPSRSIRTIRLPTVGRRNTGAEDYARDAVSDGRRGGSEEGDDDIDEDNNTPSYASTAPSSESYDSSGESLDRIAPFSSRGSVTGLSRGPATSSGGDEKDDYYSPEAWEGAYRKGNNNVVGSNHAVSSRRGSRQVSGTNTPISNDKLERGGECKRRSQSQPSHYFQN